jgi:tetratricopeptide (TPR) repeat protein
MERLQKSHATALIPEFESPLKTIVKKCLEKKPDDRYQSFIELRKDLEKILFEVTGTIHPTPQSSEYTVGDLINRGNSYSRMGFFSEAIACYDSVLKSNSYQIDAINGKAVCLLQQGSSEEALALLDMAIRIAPNDPLCRLNRGNYYFKQGDFGRALIDYRESIKQDSSDSFVWSNIGTCLLHMEKFAESLSFFNKALNIEGELAETLGNKGVALMHLDRYAEAMQCFDKSLKLDPLFIQIWHNKGLCHSAMKEHNKAIQCFDRAIELDSNYWPAFQSKGYVLLELGRDAEARDCLKKFEQISRSHCL